MTSLGRLIGRLNTLQKLVGLCTDKQIKIKYLFKLLKIERKIELLVAGQATVKPTPAISFVQLELPLTINNQVDDDEEYDAAQRASDDAEYWEPEHITRGGRMKAPTGGVYVDHKIGDAVFYKGGQYLPEDVSAKDLTPQPRKRKKHEPVDWESVDSDVQRRLKSVASKGAIERAKEAVLSIRRGFEGTKQDGVNVLQVKYEIVHQSEMNGGSWWVGIEVFLDRPVGTKQVRDQWGEWSKVPDYTGNVFYMMTKEGDTAKELFQIAQEYSAFYVEHLPFVAEIEDETWRYRYRKRIILGAEPYAEKLE